MKPAKDILLFLCILLLSGCASPNITRQVAPDINPRHQIQKDVTINARKGWQASGVTIKQGEAFTIKAGGLWTKGLLASDCSPDGYSFVGLGYEPRHNNAYAVMALLGKIGNGPEFLVGSHVTKVAETTGELFLRPNCAPVGFWDNAGGVTAGIFVQQPSPVAENKNYAADKPVTLNTGTAKSWAIIIGISKYQYHGTNGLENLIFADDDANAFAQSLRNIGWRDSHIKLLTNEAATQRNIMIALKSWLTKAGPDDQIILFWAGHGYPDPEDPEKVYLATYDTEISIPATGYRMDEVRRAIEEIGAKNVILFADTCHAGKLITRGNGNRGISIIPDIREKSIPKGWVFMVGADTDRQAIEDTSWSNGAFTHSLIKGLSGAADGFQSAGAKDGIVTMGELKDYMKTAMPDETLKVLGVAKHPVITTSTGDPDIWNLTLHKTN